MLRRLIVPICLLLLATCVQANSVAINLGKAEPNPKIFYPRQWSSLGCWDGGQWEQAAGMTITHVRLKWDIPLEKIQGLQVQIRSEDEGVWHGVTTNGGLTNIFAGQRADQIFQIRFRVEEYERRGYPAIMYAYLQIYAE
ncbi:MAG: hypothetical protein ACOYD6_02520 [Limnochordia bacterium]